MLQQELEQVFDRLSVSADGNSDLGEDAEGLGEMGSDGGELEIVSAKPAATVAVVKFLPYLERYKKDRAT